MRVLGALAGFVLASAGMSALGLGLWGLLEPGPNGVPAWWAPAGLAVAWVGGYLGAVCMDALEHGDPWGRL